MTKKTNLKTILFGIATMLTCGASSIAMAGESRDICDAAAASKYDTTRPANVTGVDEKDIDVDKAFGACRDAIGDSAVDATNARYFFQLGRVYSKKGMTMEAIAQYELAAGAGNAAAMINLGANIEDKEPAKAFSLYKRAAEAGNVIGYYNLGVAYENGIGTAVDGTLALEAYTKASDLGDDVAAYNAAVLHDDGKLMPVNKPEAIRLYTIAVSRNNVNAMFNLAKSYEKGDGVSVDKAKALDLFKKAGALGDLEAAANAKRLEAD